jgi:23S rRNA (uracil1939-C5)-methyltransferase
LVLLSVTENNEKEISALMHFLQEKFPAINSLQYVINPKRNDTIYDLEPITFYGKNYIIEKLGKYSFKIGPKSFFQTNTAQAIKLYDITKDFAGLSGEENVYDLYTGVGSIGIYLSEACKSITGIEQIEEAIKDARENASLNNVSNCTFYAGDVRMILNKDFIEKHGKADVIVTDPPRSGMHEDVVKTLLEHQSKAIVYVSCNAATQARDIAMLSEKYEVEKMRAVDMFPQTTHIENVAKLVLRR